MISGTIIGEIRIPMITVLYGMTERLRPSAASVPRPVAIMVEKKAMMKLLRTAPRQLSLLKKSMYHRVEKPAGSSDSISGVKVKNGTVLNDNGMIIRIGMIRNRKIRPQMKRNE